MPNCTGNSRSSPSPSWMADANHQILRMKYLILKSFKTMFRGLFSIRRKDGTRWCFILYIYILIYVYMHITVPGVCFVEFHSCKTITGTTVPKVQTIYYSWVCSRTSIATPLKCREVNSDWLKLLEYIVLNCFSTLVGATKSEKSRCHHKNRCPPSGWWLPLGAGLIARRRRPKKYHKGLKKTGFLRDAKNLGIYKVVPRSG